MSWELIVTLIGTIVSSNILVLVLTRKAQKKKAAAEADKAAAEAAAEEWHTWREQVEAMNHQVEFKDNRIAELLKMNQEKEARFVEQTDRLRTIQNRETEANERIIALTKENGELQLRLVDNECICHTCLHRDPPNHHTLRARAEAAAAATEPVDETHQETQNTNI